MKVENNPTAPLSPKRTDGVSPAGKKSAVAGVPGTPGRAGKDSVVVTESARLLAKARAAAVNNTTETQPDRIAELRRQVENGSYQVPVDELAKLLLARRGLWSRDGGE